MFPTVFGSVFSAELCEAVERAFKVSPSFHLRKTLSAAGSWLIRQVTLAGSPSDGANQWKGMEMRNIIIPVAAAAMMFAAAANAQEQPAQSPAAPTPATPQAPAAAPEAPATAPSIQSVTVVDIKELPENTQTQIDQVVAQGGEAQLQQLRSSVDSSPQAKSALEAKGLTSAHVVAASMSQDGALTLITKKPS